MTDTSINDVLVNLDTDRFYRIYNNVHDMLEDRGYTPVAKRLSKPEWNGQYVGYLAELEEEDNEIDAFEVIKNISLLFKRGKVTLLVYFYLLDSNLNKSIISYVYDLKCEYKCQNLLIVTGNKVTPDVSKVENILGHNFQIFKETELLINVTKHQLVPQHLLLTGEDRDVILKTYGMLDDGKVHLEIFPAIFITDPIVKYYNFKIDDLILIKRQRSDGFFDYSYRVVTFPTKENK